MTSWREEFTKNLKERDKHEQALSDLVDAYTRLADRITVLEAAKIGATVSHTTPAAAIKDGPTLKDSLDVIAQLRSELAEALRSTGQFQSRLKAANGELDALREKHKADSKQLKDLTLEKALLNTKVKDRDEELRGKAKLLEEVQDEMLSLNLQLNMAEQRSKRLQAENKELIDRWMARMGQEAEALNDASLFS